MLSLQAKEREQKGKKTKSLRNAGLIPAVLYGPKIKSQSVEVALKDFRKIYKEAGESSLVSLEVGKKKFSVLIHSVDKDPMTMEAIHVDFYQPDLEKEVEAMVPVVFGGDALAVKDLGGTLMKEIHELHVKALPENLPHDIKADISALNTFEDNLRVKDLQIPKDVKVLKDGEEIVAHVVPPQKIEEELAKPIEEKVEDVEKVETKKEKEEESPAEGEKAS